MQGALTGFVSAGLAKGFDANFNMESNTASGFFGETVANAVVGGTISHMTGGKFANGATTAAFQHLFNEMGNAAQEERTWGSYLSGTEAGDNAAQYWAYRVVNSEWYEDPTARADLFFSVLWTDETAANTTFTLGTAGVGTIWRLGLSGGSQSVFWSGNNMIRAQSFGTTLETTLIGRLVNGRIGTSSFLGRKFWEYASRTFAGNARCAATKVGTREGYFWRTFERPILERNNIPINVVP